MRRRDLLITTASVLSACGGGSPRPIVVDVFGDSLTAGRNVAVTPVERMREKLGPAYDVRDFSWPGRLASMALDGNPDGQPFGTFAGLVTSERPDVVALLYGGADVFGPDGVVAFESNLRKLVSIARANGAIAVLSTIVRISPYEAQIAPFNRAIVRVGLDTNSLVADAYSLEQGLTTDGIHLDQEWSDRRAALIASTIEWVGLVRGRV